VSNAALAEREAISGYAGVQQACNRRVGVAVGRQLVADVQAIRGQSGR
jgi:hypothetical protein